MYLFIDNYFEGVVLEFCKHIPLTINSFIFKYFIMHTLFFDD